LPSLSERNELAASLSGVVESASVIEAIAGLQSSKQLTPFQGALLGTFTSVRRLVSLYRSSSLSHSEVQEAEQLLASLRANVAVKKWAELSLNDPARCSDLQRIMKRASIQSEEQARLLAPMAEKLLNGCAAGNAVVPGVWAGLLQEDALSSVLLNEEVLLRSGDVVTGILGGIALVGGVVLAIAFPPAAPVGVALAIVGGGLIATAAGIQDEVCLNCGTHPDGSFNCGFCELDDVDTPLIAANGCITGAPMCSANLACPAGTLCAYGCCELGTTGVTASTATTAQYTVTLTFPSNLLPNQIALWAARGIQVNDRVHVLKQNLTGAPIVQVVSGNNTRLGVDSVVGTVMTGGSVTVADRANVQGDLIAIGGLSFQNRSTNVISGTVLQQAAAQQATPKRTFMGWQVTFKTTGLADVNLEPSQTLELSPNDYRNLRVKANSTLILNEGTYHFESIFIEAGAKVLVRGTRASVINVRSSLVLRGTFSQLDSPNSTLSVIYVGTNAFYANQTFRGTLIATFADINLDISNLAMAASVWGKTITIHQGAYIQLPTKNAWDVFTAALTQ
jgi:hypothetical protein